MGQFYQGGIVLESTVLDLVVDFHVELRAPRQAKLQLRFEKVSRFAFAWMRRNVELVELDFAGWNHINVRLGKSAAGRPLRLVRRAHQIRLRIHVMETCRLASDENGLEDVRGRSVRGLGEQGRKRPCAGSDHDCGHRGQEKILRAKFRA